MYEISKKFRFEASHSLILVGENHPCHSMHGHSYIAEFTFRSPILNNKDFLIDFRELDDIKKFIDKNLDHKNLNDVLLFPTTSENIAKWLYDEWKDTYPQLYSVTIKETENSSATYYSI